MVFWLGILVGAVFAWFAVRIGFYGMWAMLFNIVISVYLAIYLQPVVVKVPGLGDTLYTNALAMMGTAIAIFLILHGISYTFLTGQLVPSFPKVFNTLGSGFLGFLAGFLVWSFVSLLVYVTPISQNAFIKSVGFGKFQKTSTCISRWCGLVNALSLQDRQYSAEETIGQLLKSVEERRQAEMAMRARAEEQIKRPEPEDVETEATKRKKPGPAPEIDFEDI
ncbi:MAG: CvpA family protein [Planctomycetota bacterium]|nr:MAG: CvpA family protein [Planctomycetota bacterium]